MRGLTPVVEIEDAEKIGFYASHCLSRVAFNPAAYFYQTIRMSFTALEFVIERDEKESQCPYNRVVVDI